MDKIKIAIVDDEIGPITISRLPQEILDVLADSTSPELEEIWTHGTKLIGLPPFDQVNETIIGEKVFSDEFLNEVLMHDDVFSYASGPVQKLLSPFRDLNQQSKAILEQIVEAFPNDQFDVDKIFKRPEDPAMLLPYSLVVMDVMMDDHLDLMGVAEYLCKISQAAVDQVPMPLILLVSHRGEDLNRDRGVLRRVAQISAPGFCIVPKCEIAQNNFGSRGVQLLWQQMAAQRTEAEATRHLYRAWKNAFSAAWNKTEETLWNLDAASLQQIHLMAREDNDPFDEHLLELISRHHLWHAEGNPKVQSAMLALAEAFDAHVSNEKGYSVRFRCINYSENDLDSMSKLVSHYRWTAFGVSRYLKDFDKENDYPILNRFLPFGSILAFEKPLKEKAEVLIHLTQQCDLNRIKGKSLVFARALILKADSKISKSEESFILNGLYLENKYWNIQIFKNGLFAFPANRLNESIHLATCEVVARLRSDIARQVLQEVVNHATRIANIKVTEGNTDFAHLLLRINNGAGSCDVWYGENGALEGAKKLRVSSYDSPHLLGEESLLVPVWLARVLEKEGLDSSSINLSDLSIALRSELNPRNNPVNIGVLQVKTISIHEAELHQGDYLSKEKVGEGKCRLIVAVIKDE